VRVSAPDERTWTTTEDVMAAAGVRARSTVFLWVKRGVLPEPEIVFRGRAGRMARWPLHAPAQARWVAHLSSVGFTWEEIREKLSRGEFRTDTSSNGD
jgi:hypothetical protein